MEFKKHHLNMPLVVIVGNENNFGYFYRIKHCHKPSLVQDNNKTNF